MAEVAGVGLGVHFALAFAEAEQCQGLVDVAVAFTSVVSVNLPGTD
jgi:hypothetical protein